MPTRRQVLSALSTSPLALAQTARPNIVVVLMDDLRWDELHCTGHPFARTPNIDRIAAEGVTFRNAFVTTPLCSPSRACFLTGQYAHTHGITDNTDRSPASHQLQTFPRTPRDNGYETAFVGKWHMGVDDTPRPGFDHWVGFPGQGTYFNPVLNIDGSHGKETGYTTDILTLLELGGVKPGTALQGRSLVPWLRGQRPAWRSSFLIEYSSDRTMQRMLNMGYHAVRTDRWKYIRYTELQDMDELYDLRSDPYEMHNLIAEPSARTTLDSLRTELGRLLKT